jgi:hypothetical protein
MSNSIDRTIWLEFEQIESILRGEIDRDLEDIKQDIGKSFRQFLLTKEQDRMPFLQRIVTSHLQNMEDDRGFPPRHPVHWFKTQLEFSSTGVLLFDTEKTATELLRTALAYIEAEIKQKLRSKQQEIVSRLENRLENLRQSAILSMESVAKERKIIASELVNSHIVGNRLELKAADRFFFVDNSQRLDLQQSNLCLEVCVRSGFKWGIGKKEQIKYAVACDRLLDIAIGSFDRSIQQLHQQSQAYLNDELAPQLESLLTQFAPTPN